LTARGLRQVTPRVTGAPLQPEPFLNFSSGYVTRAMEKFPKQGSRKPWKLYQNYAKDLLTLKFGSVDDGVEFSNPAPRATAAAPVKQTIAA
jgi:hypothetical protein